MARWIEVQGCVKYTKLSDGRRFCVKRGKVWKLVNDQPQRAAAPVRRRANQWNPIAMLRARLR